MNNIILRKNLLNKYKYKNNKNNKNIELLKKQKNKIINKVINKVIDINDMRVNIFLLCYNEEILIPHTIQHYRQNIPDCKITIYDNMSIDKSVTIAKELNCEVISFNTNNKNDPLKKRDIFNNCWKNIDTEWVIVADMDEWLSVTKQNLFDEYNNNVSILSVKGYDMIGESKTIDLSDIDLYKINKYVLHNGLNKNICFYKPKIINMNYTPGHHTCKPIGDIKFSNDKYILKHMSILGLKYITNKNIQRLKRSGDARKKGMSVHYTDDINKIKNNYNNKLKNAIIYNK